LNVFAHQVDLVERFFHRRRAHNFSVNPDGKENGVHAAFAHARNVDVPIRVTFADVEGVREEALRGVVVRVQHDGRKMQRTSMLRNIVGAGV
jgi:hypothetical protein